MGGRDRDSRSSDQRQRHSRTLSFSEVDETKASGKLEEILRDCRATMGGCSIGKGLQRAARQHLDERRSSGREDGLDDIREDDDLGAAASQFPMEDPFYIVDIGVVVSQVYQCKLSS